MTTDTYRDPLTCDDCGCFESKHDTSCAQWNEDGEQYRVILNGELAATFAVLSDALDFYTEHTCHYCHTHASMHDGRCCDIQTWTRS